MEEKAYRGALGEEPKKSAVAHKQNPANRATPENLQTEPET